VELKERRIVITGAAGNIGSKLRYAFKDKFDLVLLDREENRDENIEFADFSQYDGNWTKHFSHVSTVLHLAGNPNQDAKWEELFSDNIDAVLNICHACAERKVERLVFASSCRTMGGYINTDIKPITADMKPLPDCAYGVSKVIGERICKSFSERYPFSVICLRIGWVPDGDQKPDRGSDRWLRSLWLSNRDLSEIFETSILVEGITYKILYAMSNNEGMVWDLKTSIETLHYNPQDGI
jgi:NAD+ dependent glucose-6-phosphate dehydrogenase